MADWHHLSWACPFYISNDRYTITCEGATIRFMDKDLFHETTRNHCCSVKGYHDCMLARLLEKMYEEMEE